MAWSFSLFIFTKFEKVTHTNIRFAKEIQKFKWTEEAEKAFNDIKGLLISPPVLKAPTPDGLVFIWNVTLLRKVWVVLY